MLIHLAVLVGQLLLEVCKVYGILVLGLKKLEGDCSRGVLKFERFLEDSIRRLRNLCYKRGRVLKTASLNAREEEGSSGIGNVEKAEALRDVEKVEGCKRLSPNNSGAVGSVLNYEESYKELNTERRPSYIRTKLVNNLPLCR